MAARRVGGARAVCGRGLGTTATLFRGSAPRHSDRSANSRESLSGRATLGALGRSSMTRMAVVGMALTCALLAPKATFAQISCSRDGLQRAVDLYIAAQTKGDASGLPLATGLGYVENHAAVDINSGVI